MPAQARAWEGVLRTYLDNRPHLMTTVEELAEIETLQTPQVFGCFSISAPREVPATVLNTTKTPSAPERLTNGPLRAPATTSTTREERADWHAAVAAATS